MAMKCRDLTRPRKSPKFNLHHLRKISTGFKMAVLNTKSGMQKGAEKEKTGSQKNPYKMQTCI